MKILGLIPARGGSKGISKKNIRTIGGKTLIQITFECAKNSQMLDKIILSTDDPQIAQSAKEIGLDVPFLRPDEIATDQSAMIDVAIHALKFLKKNEGYLPDALLLLQPTSPLRKVHHIQEAIGLLGKEDSVCSVIPIPQDKCPHYLMKISDGLLDFFMSDGFSYTRRQDVPQAYKRDGTIFLTKTDIILNQKSFYGKRCVPMMIKPEESLNIDTMEDLIEAEKKVK